MEKLLISACLYGSNCKYSGGNNYIGDEMISKLKSRYKLIPVCPETASGMSVPRLPSEIIGEGVFSRIGTDVTPEFTLGAQIALRLCKLYGCRKALLKEQSPSCGTGRIYDGTFSGTLTDGYGFTAQRLKLDGIELYGESQAELLLEE